jgi:predicted nucleic acid-binding protein
LRSSNLRSFEADLAKGRGLFLFPEHREFWNVATRPAHLNGLGLSHEEVLQEVSSIERLFTLRPDIPAIYPAWKAIVADNKVRGVKVYDARPVAIMTVYAIQRVLTFNTADFKRYSNITALHPSSDERSTAQLGMASAQTSELVVWRLVRVAVRSSS